MTALLLLLACSPKPASDSPDDTGGHSGDDTAHTDDSGDSGDTGDTGDTTDDSGATDADGDGFRPPDDCDDDDDTRYPGAPETCDGDDDDCDGSVDEDPVDGVTWYTDADGDHYGDPDSPQSACELPPDVTTDASDCDDTDPDIHPDATELPCTAADEDCDGQYDEGDDSARGALLRGRIYPGIQQALSAAVDGDTVWICPGTYDSDLLPLHANANAAITIAGSAQDASRVIFDGEAIDPILDGYGGFTLRDLTFRDGRNDDGDGGALYLNGDLTIERCVFEGNSSAEAGGALYWDYGTSLVIRDSVFTDNYAYNGGGAVFVNGSTGWEDWSLLVEDVEFRSNSAYGAGGALAIGRADTWSAELSRVVFDGNETRTNGAAVGRSSSALPDEATFTITDSVFTGNDPVMSAAFYLYADLLTLTVTDTTFTDTTAGGSPALLMVDGGGPYTFTDTAFVRSASNTDGGSIVYATDRETTLVCEGCDFGAGADNNDGIDLVSRCGNKADLGADVSFTCEGDGTWTE